MQLGLSPLHFSSLSEGHLAYSREIHANTLILDFLQFVHALGVSGPRLRGRGVGFDAMERDWLDDEPLELIRKLRRNVVDMYMYGVVFSPAVKRCLLLHSAAG